MADNKYVKVDDALYVYELGECIPCFPDNRGRFGTIGSDLGNGMRTFVKANKDFNIP